MKLSNTREGFITKCRQHERNIRQHMLSVKPDVRH